jgi:hypothetical protein
MTGKATPKEEQKEVAAAKQTWEVEQVTGTLEFGDLIRVSRHSPFLRI